jgi:hypothetical protein
MTMTTEDLINGLKHMAYDHLCCRETIEATIAELEHLKRRSDFSYVDLELWERWAREVCADFKIPYDNHPIGLRMAITQWMAEKLSNSVICPLESVDNP